MSWKGVDAHVADVSGQSVARMPSQSQTPAPKASSISQPRPFLEVRVLLAQVFVETRNVMSGS